MKEKLEQRRDKIRKPELLILMCQRLKRLNTMAVIHASVVLYVKQAEDKTVHNKTVLLLQQTEGGVDFILSASLGISFAIVCFPVYPHTETHMDTHMHIMYCMCAHASRYTQCKHTASMCAHKHRQ